MTIVTNYLTRIRLAFSEPAQAPFLRPKAIDILAETRKLLWRCGLYHGKRLPIPPFFQLKRTASLMTNACLIILMLMEICLNNLEFEIVMRGLGFGSVILSIQLRLVLHTCIVSKIQTLEDLLEGDVFNSQNEEQDRFIYTAMIKQKIALYGNRTCGLIFAALYGLYPVVSKQFANLPIWTPFASDKENIVLGSCKTGYVVVVVIFGSVVYMTVDCLLVGFTNIITCQVHILKDNLEHATDRNLEEDDAVQEIKIQKRIKVCIVHHNAILEFANKLQDAYSTTVFWHTIFGVLEVCLSGMELVINTNSSEMIYWIVFFGGVSSSVMLDCWSGQQVIDASMGISEACYMSEWYTCTTSTKKMFFILFEQAKRPIIIRGGGFYTLSYDTYVNILRSAYSLSAVFGQVYQNDA